MAGGGKCEDCVFFDYDEETDCDCCTADMDEDDLERFLRSDVGACPFYRRGDEYRSARRQ